MSYTFFYSGKDKPTREYKLTKINIRDHITFIFEKDSKC